MHDLRRAQTPAQPIRVPASASAGLWMTSHFPLFTPTSTLVSERAARCHFEKSFPGTHNSRFGFRSVASWPLIKLRLEYASKTDPKETEKRPIGRPAPMRSRATQPFSGSIFSAEGDSWPRLPQQ